MYLQFLSFLNTDMTQVVEIIPDVWQGPGSHSQYHGISHDTDLVKLA